MNKKRVSMKKIVFFLALICSVNNQSAQEASERYSICVVGTGYVGLVFGTGLAELGHRVYCVDIDEQKINNLRQGIIPIYEPGLSELLVKNVEAERLSFTTDIDQSIQNSTVIFIAVGTPGKQDGSADTSAVEDVVRRIGKNLNGYKIICTKSTVPVGMNSVIRSILLSKKETIDFDIVSNPEFLREGTAIYDFFNPDRIVIGSRSSTAIEIMRNLYAPLPKKNIPVVVTDTTTAETIKYASNAFLAVKLSYINEIANLCEKVGANCEGVAQGIGLDPRIGALFLKPGPGFGGSCLPKDANALLRKAQEVGVSLHVVEAALRANEEKKTAIVQRVVTLLGNDVTGKKVALWGLAFKANTDDVREAPAIDIIKQLVALGTQVQAYDPIANENMKKIIPVITYCQSKEEALVDADVLLVLTEWPEFKTVSQQDFSVMKKYVVVDTRNIIPLDLIESQKITLNFG